MAKKIKLAIVDDHPLSVEGLASLLSHFDDLEVVLTAYNGKELIEKMKQTRPDVVLSCPEIGLH